VGDMQGFAYKTRDDHWLPAISIKGHRANVVHDRGHAIVDGVNEEGNRSNNAERRQEIDHKGVDDIDTGRLAEGNEDTCENDTLPSGGAPEKLNHGGIMLAIGAQLSQNSTQLLGCDDMIRVVRLRVQTT
jgi:hypothetical protein